MAVSKNEKFLATSSKDNSIVLFDLEKRARVKTYSDVLNSKRLKLFRVKLTSSSSTTD